MTHWQLCRVDVGRPKLPAQTVEHYAGPWGAAKRHLTAAPVTASTVPDRAVT